MSIHINVGDRVIATNKHTGRVYDVIVTAVNPDRIGGKFLADHMTSRVPGLFPIVDYSWQDYDETPEPAIPTEDADNLITAATLVGKDVLVRVRADNKIRAFGKLISVQYTETASKTSEVVILLKDNLTYYNLSYFYLEEVNDG